MTEESKNSSSRAHELGCRSSSVCDSLAVISPCAEGEEVTRAADPGPAGVELIIGPYRTGKSTGLIDEVIRFCRAHPFDTALVVVPSQRYKLLFEKRLQERLQQLSESEPFGIVGLQVLPFYKACQFVLRKAGVPFLLIPDEVRPAIVARLIADLKNEQALPTLNPILDFSGTHASLIELIDELQRAALAPADVTAQLKQTAQSDSRYLEFARIYEKYWQALDERGYLDERGVAFAARKLLAQGDGSFNAGFVAADGFDRFNLLQLNVLEGLAKCANYVRITFDYLPAGDDEFGDYRWKDTSFVELETVFSNASKRFVNRIDSGESGRQTKSVRLLDRFLEAAEVARQIKQRIANGASPDQILVVARSLTDYVVPMHAAFGRENAGVTCFLDEAVKLDTLPVVQLIMRLIELVTIHQFKRRQVMTCLESANFVLPGVSESDLQREVTKLDQLSLDATLVETFEQWRELIAAKKDRLNAGFHNGLTGFFNDLTPPSSAPLRQFVVWIENLIERYVSISESHEEDQFARWEEHRALAEFRRCLASFVYEETIMGEHTWSIDSFLSRLRVLVERGNFRRVPRSEQAVTICGADLAPNRMFEEVYILGLAEGEFPRRSRQGGFLSSDEVERWLSFGIDLRNPRFNSGFETALFSSLAQRAKSLVHLSCPLFDKSGDELVPSYLITAGEEESTLETISPFSRSRSKPLSPRDALSGILWTSPAVDLNELRAMLPLTTLVESLMEPVQIARQRACQTSTGETCGDLRELVTSGALTVRLPEQWSATRLNDYGKCPFRYWLNHVLRVQPHEEPRTGLNPMQIGETYHKALELFYRTLLGRGLRLADMEQQQALSLFQSAVNAALALLKHRGDVRLGEFWQYDRNEIVFRLNRFFAKEWQRAREDQDGFVPSLLEVNFGRVDSEPRPDLKVTLRDGRSISIRGRIDRVDVAAHSTGDESVRVRLIDYKSGSAAITKEDAISGRNIQLPLYALAIERAIMPGSKVASASYLSISSGEPSGRLSFEASARPGAAPDQDSLELKSLVEQHVRNFVAGIECGDFSVRPNGRSVCGKCEHQSICRIRELPRAHSSDATDPLSNIQPMATDPRSTVKALAADATAAPMASGTDNQVEAGGDSLSTLFVLGQSSALTTEQLADHG